MKKFKQSYKIFFYILILLWVLISFFDVCYNSIKFISEAKYWLPLSDTQKRNEIFGDIYNFIIFVEQSTPERSNILILSNDDKAYYLGRYYLYPRNISVSVNSEDFLNIAKQGNFEYLAERMVILISMDTYWLHRLMVI